MISKHITIFPATTEINTAFSTWIAEYCTTESYVLDVGAGRDRIHIDAFLQPRVGHLVGVDPSKDILSNPAVDERHCMSIESFAEKEERRFDVLFASKVLEHVGNPKAFFTACRCLLKPGGSFFAATPNLWHYFGLITKFSETVGLEDWLLDRLIGAGNKADYHFPTTYRINSLHAIRRMLEQTGFQCVEFHCFDVPRSYNYVVPKPFRWFPRLYSRVMYRCGLPQFMGTIMFRATASPVN